MPAISAEIAGLVQTFPKGATPNIRTVSPQEFARLQSQLLSGAKPAGQYSGGNGAWYELPSGGRVGVRTSDKYGLTLDIDIPGLPPSLKVHQQ
jgi:filamentous hemagglutinin